MTPDDADTAYRHLVERRTPEFDREAMAPDEPRPNAWVGAAFCTVSGCSFSAAPCSSPCGLG